MKKGLLFIVFILTLIGCTNNKSIKMSDVKVINDKVILKSTSIPFTGILIENYRTGKIKSKFNYKDGKLNGKAIGYYETGEMKSKSNFKNGKTILYYKTGEIKSKGNNENTIKLNWGGNFFSDV